VTVRSGAIGIGLRAAASSLNRRSRTGHIRIGILVAGTSPAWAGRASNRTRVPWLPPIHVAPVLSDGKGGYRWNPDVYKALQWVFEEALGGINAPTLPEVRTTVTQTQTEVIATQSYATAVGAYAQGVAATATATAQVAQSNSLAGATSIPDAPEPPERFPGA
jgi:hypothetical protein